MVVIAVIVGGALYITVTNRRRQRETNREAGNTDALAGMGLADPKRSMGGAYPTCRIASSTRG